MTVFARARKRMRRGVGDAVTASTAFMLGYLDETDFAQSVRIAVGLHMFEKMKGVGHRLRAEAAVQDLRAFLERQRFGIMSEREADQLEYLLTTMEKALGKRDRRVA